MTRSAKPKAPHEQDVRAAAIAARSTRFSAFLFTGVGGRYRREAGSFRGAVDAALSLKAGVETHRRPLVYAIDGTATVEVDEAVARLAGFDEADIARLFDRTQPTNGGRE